MSSRQRKGVTVARIIEAALTVFAEQGNVAPIGDIASALGIRKASLFEHVKSKAEIIGLVRLRLSAQLATVIAVDDNAFQGLEPAEALCERLLRYFSEDRRRPRFVLRDLLDDSPAFDSVITTLIEKMRGSVTGDDRRVLAVTLDAFGALLATGYRSPPDDDVVRAHVRALLQPAA